MLNKLQFHLKSGQLPRWGHEVMIVPIPVRLRKVFRSTVSSVSGMDSQYAEVYAVYKAIHTDSGQCHVCTSSGLWQKKWPSGWPDNKT